MYSRLTLTAMCLKTHFLLALLALAAATGCKNNDPELVAEPTSFTATTFVSGLTLPLGMSVDGAGQAWITQSGTGKNDAQVSLITTDAKVYPVVTGLASIFANGAIEGIGHLLYRDGMIYVLEGETGRLYIVDVTSFKACDTPYVASSLSAENIGTFVKAQQLTTPVNSNLYNLVFGPDNNLYIIDSGANAIIRRDSKTKQLSVFAKLPNVTPTAEAVPTGIVYDGNNFLVSSLTGFPFSAGAAKIFLVSPAGAVSEYQSGFTTLTDLTLAPSNKPIVVQYSQFSLAPPTVGFTPKTGLVADGSKTTLLSALDRPTDIERVGSRTYYVLCWGDGTLQKLTY